MGETSIQRIEHGLDVAKAAADAEQWGFPRSVRPEELSDADWFRMGSSVVFWFQHFPVSTTYFVHVAVKPEAQRRWPVRRWLAWVERYAAEQGATELGFVRCDGAEESEAYLRRLHWADVPYGLGKPLEAA